MFCSTLELIRAIVVTVAIIAPMALQGNSMKLSINDIVIRVSIISNCFISNQQSPLRIADEISQRKATDADFTESATQTLNFKEN